MTSYESEMDKRENDIHLTKVANDAYLWAFGEESALNRTFETGFLMGIEYALNYAKLNSDGITLQVRPLPGCAFPNPYVKENVA